MLSPTLAASKFPPELIIWLIIGFFWLVGTVVERIRKANAPQKPAPRPRPTRPEEPGEEEPAPESMEELQRRLKEMLGLPVENVPPREEEDEAPGPSPAPAPQPVARETPRPQRPRRSPPPLPAGPTAMAYDEESVRATGDRHTPPQETGFGSLDEMVDIDALMKAPIPDRQSTVNVQPSLVNLSRLKMPLLRTHVLTNRASRSRTEHPDVRNPRVLRQTLVGSILLGPPKAME